MSFLTDLDSTFIWASFEKKTIRGSRRVKKKGYDRESKQN